MADKTKNIVVAGSIFFLIGFIVIVHVPIFEDGDERISIRDMIANTMTEDEPVACIQIFDPVCDTQGMTWSNQCIAENAGATVLFKGECP